jgi:hypothetical protein
MDSPTSGPEGLYAHPHSEQAQPRKFWLSAHTSLRRIAVIARSDPFCGDLSLKSYLALLFNHTATAKAGLLIALGGFVPRLPTSEHTSKPN